MIELFIVLVVNGTFLVLGVDEVPTFDTISECNKTGLAVVKLLRDDVPEMEFTWICEEKGNDDYYSR